YVMSGRKEKTSADTEHESSEILRVIREKGIGTAEELRERLEREEKMQKLFGSETYSVFLEAALVRERQVKYETKSSRKPSPRKTITGKKKEK
ncbi:MAG: hypothetical protein KGJ59_14895, partial [Bacteroidota bacterium]|nr:hypothetical protein [Bacteroidota bacterium]